MHPIADLQIEYSLLSRGIEDEILPTTRELGIAVTAYGVLSRGLLSGHWNKDRDVSGGDFRGAVPRFQGENLDHNLRLVEALRAVAEAGGGNARPGRDRLGASRGEDIVPLVGARRRDRLAEALGALELELDLARVEAAIPAGAAKGARYPDMAGLPA